MKFYSALLLFSNILLASSEARHVVKRLNEEGEPLIRYLVIAADRLGLAGLAENRAATPEVVALSQQDASSGNQIPTDAEARGPFNDFVPFVSNYVYRDSVKKYIIQPIIKGTKCLVPRRAVAYYKSNLAHRRFFKLTSPVYTAVSIYANKKLEQGVYWTLNRGFRWVRDNVFTND